MPTSEAWNALYKHKIVKEQNNLPSNEYHILARTDLRPMNIQDDYDGRVRTIAPPNKCYEAEIVEDDRSTAFWKCNNMARKISLYVAYSVGYAVPMFCIYVGKDMLFQYEYVPFGLAAYDYLREEAKKEEWFNSLKKGYGKAEELLNKVPDSGYLDRAICSAGIACIGIDEELSFLSSWKVIELISENDFCGYMKDNSVKKWKFCKVMSTLKRRKISVNKTEVCDMYQIRNKIAHSALNAEDFRKMMDKFSILRELSLQVLASALGDMDFNDGDTTGRRANKGIVE
jgi:hypothetical protein